MFNAYRFIISGEDLAKKLLCKNVKTLLICEYYAKILIKKLFFELIILNCKQVNAKN